MPVDDSKVSDYLVKLESKASDLGSQLQEVRQHILNLKKIQPMQTGFNVQAGVQVPITTSPIDQDTSLPMTDSRKQEIFNAHEPSIKKVLGIQ